jgi:hypothetical protein
MTISGMITLTNVSARNGMLIHFGVRASPSAPSVPNVVARIAVRVPTTMLFQRLPWMIRSPRTWAYQRRLSPSQSVTRRSVALKLNTTTTTIGTNRNR